MNPRSLWLVLALFISWAAGATPAAGQQVIYVRAGAPAGGNGQSWATAYNDLQVALDQAGSIPAPQRNHAIWVAEGVYKPSRRLNPSDPRSASFQLLRGVTILGGFQGTEVTESARDSRLRPTVLSGDLEGNDALNFGNRIDNSYSVVSATDSDTSAILDGFHVRGGNGSLGGGVHSAAPCHIRDCFIYDNEASSGGGCYTTPSGWLFLERCWITGNRSTAGYGGAGGAGHITLVNSLVTWNTTQGDGGGVGTGISSLHILNSTVAYNTAHTSGGAGHLNLSSVSFRQSIFYGNSSPSGSLFRISACTGEIERCSATGTNVRNPNQQPSEAINIDGDPFFADPDGADNVPGNLDDDFRLLPQSNCVDSAVSASPFGVADVAMRRRLADGNSDGVALVDLGAYERNAPPYSPVLYVRTNATGSNNGSSWADAFSGPLGLRRAIELCALNTNAYPQIWVAGGTYKPDLPVSDGGQGDRSISFVLFQDVGIYGGFAGTETSLGQRTAQTIAGNPTILSGDLQDDDIGFVTTARADNSHHVVTSANQNSTAMLDGFIIEKGGQGLPDIGGGGLFVSGGGATIRNCEFRLNMGDAGGGCQAVGSSGLRFENCHFRNNRTTGWDGAAFQCSGGNGLLFDNCRFEDNQSGRRGGAFYISTQGGVVVQNCKFIRNKAKVDDVAGAVYFYNSAGAFYNSEFYGNRAIQHTVIAHSSQLTIAGCAFVGNTAGNNCGIAGYGPGTVLQVINCTLASNHAEATSGGVRGAIHVADASTPSTLLVSNCIVKGNTAAGVESELSNVSVTSSSTTWSVANCIVGEWANGAPGSGNFDVPLENVFRRAPSPGPDEDWGTVDDDYGDLRLLAGSLAIDSGSTNLLPPDAGDIDSDLNFTEPLPEDLDGRVRYIDDPNAANIGPGDAPHVDRGCYENNLSSTTWANAAGGQWTLPANWVNSVLPNSNTRVRFDSTAGGSSNAYAVQLPSNQFAYALELIANQVTLNARSGSSNGDLVLTAPSSDPAGSLIISRVEPTGQTPSLTITNSGGLTTSRRGLFTGNTVVARETGSRGALVVGDSSATNGQRTHLIASGTMQIGAAGTGSFAVQSRALAEVETLLLAVQAGSGATATVTGAGGIASALGYGGAGTRLIVGERGSATMNIGSADHTRPGWLTSEGFPADRVVVGEHPGSSGSVSVLGPGSLWISEHAQLRVGERGHGSVLIDGGQWVTTTSDNIILAEHPGSTALVELRNGANWTETGAGVVIGGNGAAEVRIDASSSLSFGAGPLRIDPAGALMGNGTVTVAARVSNAGTIAPGIGTLPMRIEGVYDQVSSDPQNPYAGNVVLSVQGTLPGQYASLEIVAQDAGDIELGGGIIINAPSTLTLTQPLRLISTPGHNAVPRAFDVALLPTLRTPDGELRSEFLRIDYAGGGADLGVGTLLGNIGFSTPLDFPVPGQASDAALADMDNDGLIDLVVTIPAASGPGSAFIFFNAGDQNNDGQWDGFSESRQLTTGVNPVALTLNNFDGAGARDLAVANQGSGTVSVIYHTGARTYGNTLSIPVGSAPTAIDSARINAASELPGIAVAVTGTSPATLLLNNQQVGGGNNFLMLPLPVLPTPVAPPPPRRIRLPDLDQDKRSEVTLLMDDTVYATRNVGSSQMTWLPGLPVGEGAADLRVADLDFNGVPELITANATAGTISVLVNRSSVGSVQLLPAVDLPVGNDARSLVAVDLEGDGDRDLAVIAEVSSGVRQVRLLRNDTEQAERLVLSLVESRASGDGPLFVLAADLDGGGLEEVVTINEDGGGLVPNPEVVVTPNRGSLPLVCGTSDFDGDGDFGTDADIEAFFACLGGNCCGTCYAGGSDFNADGDVGTDADIESFFRVLGGGAC